jgi:hypothetical protein
MPANTVKVDRTTLFGNPFSAEQHGRSGAVRMFELWLDWKLPGVQCCLGDCLCVAVAPAVAAGLAIGEGVRAPGWRHVGAGMRWCVGHQRFL